MREFRGRVAVVTGAGSGIGVQALADRTVSEFGAVHLVCNNAGVGVGSDFAKIPLDVWEWVLGVDLWGVSSTGAGRSCRCCSSRTRRTS